MPTGSRRSTPTRVSSWCEAAEVGRLAVSITDHPTSSPSTTSSIAAPSCSARRKAPSSPAPCRVVAWRSRSTATTPGPARHGVWSIKGYAVEIEQMHQYFDALELPLFPGTPLRSTGSCGSNRSRSADANSAFVGSEAWTGDRRSEPRPPRNERRLTDTGRWRRSRRAPHNRVNVVSTLGESGDVVSVAGIEDADRRGGDGCVGLIGTFGPDAVPATSLR